MNLASSDGCRKYITPVGGVSSLRRCGEECSQYIARQKDQKHACIQNLLLLLWRQHLDHFFDQIVCCFHVLRLEIILKSTIGLFGDVLEILLMGHGATRCEQDVVRPSCLHSLKLACAYIGDKRIDARHSGGVVHGE